MAKLDSINKLFIFFFVIFLQGVNIVFTHHKLSSFLGIFLIFISVTAILYLNSRTSIQERIFTINVRYKYLFSFFGIIALLSTAFVEYFYLDGNVSEITLLCIVSGIFLIFYPHIPSNYSKEVDFLLVFLVLLCTFLVLPSLYLKFISPSSSPIESKFFLTFIIKPVLTLCNIFGINTWNSGRMIFYENLEKGVVSQVEVSETCSGYFSVAIFIAGFFSYIFQEYRILNVEVFLFLLLGLLGTYISNLIRMSVIISIGHLYGNEALLWSHENLGFILFTLWVFIFWSFILKYLPEGQTFKS